MTNDPGAPGAPYRGYPPSPPAHQAPRRKGGCRRMIGMATVAALVGLGCASEAEPFAQEVLGSEELTLEERGYTTDGDPERSTARCADNPDCAAAASNPTTTTTAPYDDPRPEDFTIEVIVLSESCFGSAGCNVTYEIEVGWLLHLDPSMTYQLTYEVTGSEYGTSTDTVEITGEEYVPPFEAMTSTPNAGVDLIATPVRVR